MSINLLPEGATDEDSVGIGTATRAMLRDRAFELAVVNGRSPLDVLKSDWEQAKQELAPEAEL